MELEMGIEPNPNQKTRIRFRSLQHRQRKTVEHITLSTLVTVFTVRVGEHNLT